ncbi:gem-associated protein 4-like [Glandiceps talaboti]
MEFSEEIAVLQGSFLLAQKQVCPQKINELSKNQCQHCIETVSEAVNDIVNGLSSDHNDITKNFWLFKIHAVIFVKWLETQIDKKKSPLTDCSDDVESGGQWEGIDYFAAVSCAIPSVGTPFFIELVKNVSMTSHCVQCLLQLPQSTASLCLEEIMNHIATDTQNSDLKFWCELLDSTIVHVTESSLSTQQHGCQLLSQIIELFGRLKEKFEGIDLKGIVKLLSGFVQWIVRNGVKDGEADAGTGVSVQLSDTEVIQLCENVRESIPRNLSMDTSLQVTNLTKHLPTIPHQHAAHLRNANPKVMNSEQGMLALRSVITVLVNILSNEWLEWSIGVPKNGHVEASTQDKDLTESLLKLCDALTKLQSTKEFTEYIDSDCMPEFTAEIQTLLERVKSATASFVSVDEEGGTKKETPVIEKREEEGWKEKFKDVVWNVSERLTGYDESMEWLLTNHQQLCQDVRWIDCIKTNLPWMSSTRFCIQLVDILYHEIKGCTTEVKQKDFVFQLKKCLLQCMKSLPVISQNLVRDHMVGNYGLPTIFEEPVLDSFRHDLTTVFNKVVNTDEKSDFTEILSAVSCLAFQSPYQTLLKAVTVATRSSAQIHLIIEILQSICSLCNYKTSSEETILCQILHQVVSTLVESSTEQSNCLEFVRKLLKPYRSPLDPANPFTYQPILDIQELMTICVLPYISLNSNNSNSTVPLLTALQLFKVAMETDSTIDDSYWLLSMRPFPIMLCLCSLLEECIILWDDKNCYHGNQKLEMKELTLDLLQQSMDVVKKAIDNGFVDNTGVYWLLSRIQTMHWTIPLHFVSFLQHTGIGFKQYLMKETLMIHNLFKITLIAMVQVLPQCTWMEWRRVIHVMQQLMHDGILEVPYGTKFIKQLPFFSFQDCVIPLSTCQLLTSLLHSLSDSSCVQWTSLSLWRHVTKLYAATIKDLTQDITPGTSSTEFIINQFFCHSCQVLSTVPEDVTDQVFVLALELLNMIQANQKTGWGQTTNQNTVLVSAINLVPECEHRKRLFQKLKN